MIVKELFHTLKKAERLDVSDLDPNTGLGARILTHKPHDFLDYIGIYGKLRIISKNFSRYLIAINLIFGIEGFEKYSDEIAKAGAKVNMRNARERANKTYEVVAQKAGMTVKEYKNQRYRTIDEVLKRNREEDAKNRGLTTEELERHVRTEIDE